MTFPSNVLLYQSPDGNMELQVQLQNETVWLTQAQMAELFGRDQGVISRHLKNVFSSGELNEEDSVQKLHLTAFQADVGAEKGFMQKLLVDVQLAIITLTLSSPSVIVSIRSRAPNSVSGPREFCGNTWCRATC